MIPLTHRFPRSHKFISKVTRAKEASIKVDRMNEFFTYGTCLSVISIMYNLSTLDILEASCILTSEKYGYTSYNGGIKETWDY